MTGPAQTVSIRVGGCTVSGTGLDAQTRCVHYRSAVDVVAILFFCCRRWYPCLHCHDDDADHPIVPWPAGGEDAPAVLCGVCASRLSISAYRGASACPRCAAAFNPRCALHASIYFS